MIPAPVGTSPLHWAITLISVALITGLFAVAGTWLGRRADGKKAEERTRVSVDLHRAAFDGAVEELEQRLSEYPVDEVGRRQDFEHGRLEWHPSGAVKEVKA